MLTDTEKLDKIKAFCSHPGAFHWTGRDMARVIQRIIDDVAPDCESPIYLVPSRDDEPIDYQLVHDEVYAGDDE